MSLIGVSRSKARQANWICVTTMSHNRFPESRCDARRQKAATVRAESSSCGTQPAHISLTPPSLTNDRRSTALIPIKRKPPRH